jgi:hypothetical protein
MTMQLIESVTVGSGGASSIEFTSIPQDGTDLVVLFSGRAATSSSPTISITFNSDTGSNYALRRLRGDGATVSSASFSAQANLPLNQFLADATSTSNTFSNNVVYLPNYTSTVAKSVSIDHVQENNGTTSWQHISAGSYSGTSAITSINMVIASGTIAENSTASLYKVTSGSDGITSVS